MNGIKLSAIESDRRYARYVRERNKILFGENKKNIKDKIVDIVLVGMLVWSFILLTVFTILLLAQLFK